MSRRPKGSTTSLYLIQSLDNGGVYVGVSSSPKNRWADHQAPSRGRQNKPLYNSLRKYGLERHTFAVVEVFPSFEGALEAEVWWIAYLRGLGARIFNLTDGGEGTQGYRATPETRAKLSAAHLGKKHTPEQTEKIREALRGRIFTPEWCAKISEANMGRVAAPETLARLSAAHVGKRHSPEACAKIGKAHKDRVFSEAHRAKLSAAGTGRRHSPETRAKLAQIKTGLRHTPEAKRKLSDQIRTFWEENPERIFRGSKNPQAKLTEEQVLEIRGRLARGETHRAIGRVFGVSHTVIGYIASGRTWTHVEVHATSSGSGDGSPMM